MMFAKKIHTNLIICVDSMQQYHFFGKMSFEFMDTLLWNECMNLDNVLLQTKVYNIHQ